MSLKIAVYPGTIDPVTNGHLDLIYRATKLFDKVIVAVAFNPQKRPFFTLEERITLIKNSLELKNSSQIEVEGFNELFIEFAKSKSAAVILRGLRAASDFEYEFQLAGMNRKLCAEVETVFLTPSDHAMFISSSLVREIALLGGDIKPFVPTPVAKALKERKI